MVYIRKLSSRRFGKSLAKIVADNMQFCIHAAYLECTKLSETRGVDNDKHMAKRRKDGRIFEARFCMSMFSWCSKYCGLQRSIRTEYKHCSVYNNTTNIAFSNPPYSRAMPCAHSRERLIKLLRLSQPTVSSNLGRLPICLERLSSRAFQPATGANLDLGPLFFLFLVAYGYRVMKVSVTLAWARRRGSPFSRSM